MPIDCQRSTSGGKGNLRMFIERDPRICAAGAPTGQPDESVAGCLQHYLLKDEADALISDALIPPPKPRPLLPLRHPIPIDKRNAGPFSESLELLNPPIKTKFQTLVDDFKDTAYASYWKKPLGEVQDPVPMLPENFDVSNTTFGKKTVFHGRLYDIVMPKEPFPDNTPRSKQPGVQIKRNYCKPPFNPDLTFGHRTFIDKRGRLVKCCLTDDRIVLGNTNHTILNSIQSNFQDATVPRCGVVLAPNNNIKDVPKGYSFGILKPPDNLPECLTTCKVNPEREEFKKCLKSLNTLRKCLKSRFLPTFFHKFYRTLKYFDKEKTGWLPKDVVYKCCGNEHIRLDPKLIERLLLMWNAYDGSNIEYKTFVHVLNYREPSPELPKVPDVPDSCLDFKTTYREMVKLDKEPDHSRMAGIPSGRYFDLDYPNTPNYYCKADRTCLPDESDMKSCINPSILTVLHVNHRDMYAKRDPDVIRRVFEAGNEKFTDEQFNTIWEAAKKYHSQEWVCYETFRRALEEIKNPQAPETKKNKKHH